MSKSKSVYMEVSSVNKSRNQINNTQTIEKTNIRGSFIFLKELRKPISS